MRHYSEATVSEKIQKQGITRQWIHVSFLVLGFTAGLSFSTAAQVSSQASRSLTFFDSSDRMLPVLIESALINSPQLTEINAQKRSAELDYQLSKKQLLRNFSVNSSYNYGNSNTYFPTDAVQPVPLWYSNHTQSMYTVGAGFSLNLEQLFGGNRLRREKELANINRTDAQLQGARNLIRQQVIAQFQALKLARVVFLQRQNALQSLFVNKELVDKKFREGSVKIGDQMDAERAYNEAYLLSEEAKNAYQTQVLLLEELVGMPITPLLSKYFK